MAQECLICLENILPSDRKVVCLVCHKIVHYDCFHEWNKKKMQPEKLIVCVYCQQSSLLIEKETCCDCNCFGYFFK